MFHIKSTNIYKKYFINAGGTTGTIKAIKNLPAE